MAAHVAKRPPKDVTIWNRLLESDAVWEVVKGMPRTDSTAPGRMTLLVSIQSTAPLLQGTDGVALVRSPSRGTGDGQGLFAGPNAGPANS